MKTKPTKKSLPSGPKVAQGIDWLTAGIAEKEQHIAPGTGAVVKHGLATLAVYRYSDGTFHECSAVCPHLGGIVAWNHAEKTWDCAAHGSRFDRLGNVQDGPADQNLSSNGVSHPIA